MNRFLKLNKQMHHEYAFLEYAPCVGHAVIGKGSTIGWCISFDVNFFNKARSKMF